MRAGSSLALAALALAGLLSGCAANPPPAARVHVPPPAPKIEPLDTCGLKGVRNLVGQPKSAIPVPVTPSLRRVSCTTCVQAQDFNPRRLNIYFDADTGIIERVACG